MEQFERTIYHPPLAGLRGPELLLDIFDGEGDPVRVDLRAFGRPRITFGRAAQNDIVLSSRLVSRLHGEFLLAGDSCVLQDMNSTNGLVVNGRRVAQHVLAEGDQIRIDDPANPAAQGVLLLLRTASAQDGWSSFALQGQAEITIGRDSACDILLPHVSVSRRHARILREGESYALEDCGSTNGVSINGEPLAGRHLLRERDIILIANAKLVFSSSAIRYYSYAGGISLEARHISKSVPAKGGPRLISNDISLSIAPCELVAIIGGSGAGKTTFMNCISGSVPASSGQVLVNGEELYRNYEVIKSVIGYVPQQDIVHDDLALGEMLSYASRLRMPRDTSPEERERRIARVLEMVELQGNEDTIIRSLSGGQKKRASIAVELLSDPGLFFLDEPTSGLDPGIERNLMHTLRGMAAAGKTIVLVTHNIQNLHLCDKLIILGPGGVLCYYGPPEEALPFFGAESLVDVYNILAADPIAWRDRYGAIAPATASAVAPAATPASAAETAPDAAPKASRRKPRGQPLLYQLRILCGRYVRLILRDRQKLAILLLQAPLLALLIAMVANGSQFEEYESTKSLLFALACSAFWVGILNSIQEICKERSILRREYLSGLRLSAYMASKLLVLGGLCLLQTLLLAGVFSLAVGSAQEGLLLSPFLEMWITTFLTALSAAAMGLCVSSFFGSPDRAMTVAPFLLLPQILFSGLIFELTDTTEIISAFVPCRWAMEGYGTVADLNALPYKLMEQGLPLVHEAEKYFTYTGEHLLRSWAALALTVTAFILAGMLALRATARRKY